MYNPAVNKHAKVFAKKLLDACADNKEISIPEYVTLCSLDIICGNLLIGFIKIVCATYRDISRLDYPNQL